MRPTGRARHPRKLLHERARFRVPDRFFPDPPGRERVPVEPRRRAVALVLFLFRFGLDFAEDFLWTRSGSRVPPVSRFHSS